MSMKLIPIACCRSLTSPLPGGGNSTSSRRMTSGPPGLSMRGIRIDKPGGPEVMRLEEVELPPPGKGEVRLRQHAIGINFIDIYRRSGFYPPAHTPFTPGSEGAGEVVAVGASVVGLKRGDRVAYAGSPGAHAGGRHI